MPYRPNKGAGQRDFLTLWTDVKWKRALDLPKDLRCRVCGATHFQYRVRQGAKRYRCGECGRRVGLGEIWREGESKPRAWWRRWLLRKRGD